MPVSVAHICSTHLAPFTDQLLAPNQKGQVGVLGRGRKEKRDYAQLFHTGNEEAAVRMRLGERLGEAPP